jgi:outer membrane protein
MKSLVLINFAVAIIALSSSESSAQTTLNAAVSPALQKIQPSVSFPDGARVAYVDINRVAALSGEGKAAAAKLESLRNRKSAEVSERSKQVAVLQQKLSQGETILNDVARARLQKEFQRAQVDFQRFTEDAQAEVQHAQQQLLDSFTARLFPVIGKVATEKNLWAVFSSDSGLLWHNPALDLSEEVAKQLDLESTKR